MYAINGIFVTQRLTGVQRFSIEIICRLDKICKKGEFLLVLPNGYSFDRTLKNISVVNTGKNKNSIKWEQTDFKKYVKKNKYISLNLGNSMPLLSPGPIVIHDLAYILHHEFFSSAHGKLSCKWHKMIFDKAAKGNYPIYTVSLFSKYQLIYHYHNIDPQRIIVLGNGWDHDESIQADDSILEKNHLTNREYFFTLGSQSINKNTKYIYEVAKRNPDKLFVLTGAKAKVSKEHYEQLENVINLGYLSDEQIKSLMIHCTAFIFPSIHEGFGIPPLEALSYGKKIIVSGTSCLPEIYGSSASYIDPYDFSVDLDEKVKEKNVGRELVLAKYRWDILAQKFYDSLVKDK